MAEKQEPDDLAELRAKARWHRSMSDALDAEIAAREKIAALTIGRESSTSETPMQSESAGAKASHAQIAPKNADHKFVQMLVRRKLSVGDVATFLTAKLKREVPRPTVQAWYKRADDVAYRAIPEDAALALKDEYAVPILAWARIRKPKP